MKRLRFIRVCSLVIMLAPFASCEAPFRGPAVPANLEDQAVVFNDPALRTWDDSLNPAFMAEVYRVGKTEIDRRKAAGETGPLSTANYLAISGGGANGAYGAGILCGWTAAGTRPEFKMVTGISTGALTAPFAFLGPTYDDKLRKVYTSVTTKDICTSRGIMGALFNDAMMDTTPLRHLMNELVDEQMMHDIAREYARGRFLMIATTNLDANRGVVWNIGAIAASGNPKVLDLIHTILIASAAIPAAFPPVMIDVQADGKAYQEMHVDGGAKAQVFLYPPSTRLRAVAAAVGIERNRAAYVIRNSRLDPQWADVERKTFSIASRAIDSLIQTQGVGNIYLIYAVTQRDGVDFNLAFIPSDFNLKPAQAFDPVYMTKLFDVGYAAAKSGYHWSKAPPGYAEEEAHGGVDIPVPPPAK